MIKYKTNILIIFTFLLLITSANSSGAVEIFARDTEHRGVIDFAPYQIYPENRIGNGIYLDKKLLDSHPQRVILNIVNIKNSDNHIYLFRGLNGVLGMDIVKTNGDADVRFWQVDQEFYQYSDRTSGTRKVFRIFQDQIVPLLPHLRTGTGVATSPTHAVFYHISNSKNVTSINQNGHEITNRIYTFSLHLVKRDLADIVSISDLPIQDVSYTLKLDWVNENSVSYKLSNGEKHIIDLRKYAPSLF